MQLALPEVAAGMAGFLRPLQQLAKALTKTGQKKKAAWFAS